MNKKITENDLYAKLRKEREELYKIIGKEGITDQKVRIDKYAHLYVLQDEMTEYLRARRLSQAEIEKLYAVENFYEYIQNYLLHHKDVFNYHGYKIGRVFDISQTHGKAGVPALSLKDNTPEMDAALRRLLDSSPVPVVTSSTMYQDAVYDPKTQSITVSSRLIDSKIFAALSREIVHAGIHDHGRYPYYTREDCAMDAESVSYMLCRNFGVETPQPDVSRVGQVFDGMEVQDRRGVVDSLQKYFRKLQNDIQREISPQERKQPEQNRSVR